MQWPRLPKHPEEQAAANLKDYDSFVRTFSWDQTRALLRGLPGGGLNIAHEAVDRHVQAGHGSKLALRWLGRDDRVRDFSYSALSAETNRFANILAQHGIAKGDRVFSLLGRSPELYIAALGTLKNGSVFSPLYSVFGPEPIKARMTIGNAKALVTSTGLYLQKIEPWRKELAGLEHIFVTDCAGNPPPGTVDLAEALANAAGTFEIVRTNPEDMALLHFTSGTTGQPKGAVHVHEAVVAHQITGRLALDLRADDIFWCTADPGWVTGTSYGIISPLANGATMIVDQAEFDAVRWYHILQDQKVSVWYTDPTAIRMLMNAGTEIARRFDLSHLRFMASVGEPLNPEAVVWGVKAFGKPFHDTWWQTETGAIMIANYLSMDVKPGSMGRPLPGIAAGIVEHSGGDTLEEITEPMAIGELALRSGWPSMMRAYLNEDELYRHCFADGWYLTGDLAMRDDEGFYWFAGRTDDMIKSAGHFISPFEVESALIEHPAVAEACVIGVPEPILGEVVKAFIAIKSGFEASEALRKDLLGHAQRRLGPAVAPKEIAFRNNLPKTRSGKIIRRQLKAGELGSELQEREAKIRRLVEANIIGIIIWDFEGRIIDANDAFLQMVGYDRDDLVSGRVSWTDLTPPEWHEVNERNLAEIKRTGALQPFEKEYYRKDGSRVPVLIGAATFGKSGNQGVAFVLDLSEHKRAEAQIRESERRYSQAQTELAHANRVVTMGQLTASIAHEVSQPVASAITNAQAALRWLRAQPPNLEEVEQALGRIVKDGFRAGDVLCRIRDLVKKAPPRKDVLDVNEAILEVIALTRAELLRNGVSVQTQLADELPLIEADRTQLQQVLLNLIINAVEAMSGVSEGPRDLLISTANGGRDGVLIAVQDSGPGLCPESLNRIFDPFYSTKPDGMGMGLSICHSIIEAHGGRLWTTANTPRGAIFHVNLPVCASTGSRPESLASAPAD